MVVVSLKKNIPNKIHIIGSVGSGKTTLARELSSKLNIPFYELDNVMWKRYESGDIRRTEEGRVIYYGGSCLGSFFSFCTDRHDSI